MRDSNQTIIEIRTAIASDAQTIADYTRAIALETENVKLDPDVVLNGVLNGLDKEKHGFYVVATDQSRIVGCLMVTYEWSDWRNCVQWWLQSVYVAAEYRRLGIFSKLYEFVVKLASKSEGVCGIRLYVEKDNHRAIAVYESLGMEQTDYRVYESAL